MNLGWCVPCRYAASQGGTDNPFERAEYLLNGMGMCAACMLHTINTFITLPTQLNAMINVPDRRPPRPSRPNPQGG